MLRRVIRIVVVAGFVVFGALIWGGAMHNPFESAAKQAQAANGPLNFRLMRNDFGDRVLLVAGLHVSFFPQSDSPDRITMSEKDGNYSGDFAWTLIQTPRGESRLLGEVRTGGRAYRVCEFLKRVGDGKLSAERFSPVNNDGVRSRNPEKIDPSSLQPLLVAMIALRDKIGKDELSSKVGAVVPPELARMATDISYFCINQAPTAAR